ncbi:hypothetical protein [Paulownia witches'-broom phytoplasma]|uniref:hypothetical protein n=1 Tax=Paulownia witches'-broom phytoplasma TaxID=39647 RepID=UPI001CEDCA7B|nr:hypothetical protein [Paulownia witches'-broom phytoplasma]GLH60787.1 hypothetical protein PAWBP_5250 [Paulownia witches'-broom phytoplasma]
MDKKQKIKKEFYEHCQCFGTDLGISVDYADFTLFGVIMALMILISFVGIFVLFGFSSLFSFFQINHEIFTTLIDIFGIGILSYCLIIHFMPKLLFEKVDYEKVEKVYEKNNLFDNFFCLLMGSIIGIFLYINFFIKNNKEIEIIKQNNKPVEIIKEIEKPIEIIKYVNLIDSQKLDLIKKLKNNFINYNNQNYLYKKDIENILNNFK